MIIEFASLNFLTRADAGEDAPAREFLSGEFGERGFPHLIKPYESIPDFVIHLEMLVMRFLYGFKDLFKRPFLRLWNHRAIQKRNLAGLFDPSCYEIPKRIEISAEPIGKLQCIDDEIPE